jgi:hypothetical protein
MTSCRPEEGHCVDAHCALDLLVGALEEHPPADNPRVVDKHVNAPSLLRSRINVLPLRNVHLHKRRLPPRRNNFRRDPAHGALVEVPQDDLAALPQRQPLRHERANSAAGAGDECRTAFDVAQLAGDEGLQHEEDESEGKELVQHGKAQNSVKLVIKFSSVTQLGRYVSLRWRLAYALVASA